MGGREGRRPRESTEVIGGAVYFPGVLCIAFNHVLRSAVSPSLEAVAHSIGTFSPNSGTARIFNDCDEATRCAFTAA